jgi:STE24 endopeptidase
MANEDKSARYHRLRRRVAAATTVWRVGFLLGLAASGGAAALRDRLAETAGPGLVPLVVLYVATLVLVYEGVRLPLAWYEDVVLERRYGLSTGSPLQWLAEYLQGTVLLAAVLAAAALVVSGLLRWSPDRWWIAAAAGAALGLVLVVQLGPTWLLPLVHDLRPLPRQALRERLLALADRARAPVLDVYEWRVGDRTTKANAALVGVGPTRRILISDTLLAAHDDDEIEAVLAHELAHHVYGDVWSALAVEAGLVVAGCYLADVALGLAVGPFALDGKADVAALPLLALSGGAVALALLPIARGISREHERRADRYAIGLTGNAPAFISAMRRLAARNLAEERPSRLVRLLFHTHPPFTDRIAAASRTTTAGPRT